MSRHRFEQTITISLQQSIDVAGAHVKISPQEEGTVMSAMRERYKEDGGPAVIPFRAIRPMQGGPSLRECWLRWIEPDCRLAKETKVGDRTSLKHWERIHGQLAIGVLAYEHLQAAAGNLNANTARKVFAVAGKLLRRAVREGMIDKLPEFPPLPRPPARAMAEVVSPEDADALYRACKIATWPKLGGLSPEFVWQTWLMLFWIYGARTQDFVGYKTAAFAGLLWKNVVCKEACPVQKKTRWRHGWLNYTPTKTRHSSGSQVVMPIHSLLRPRLDRFVGLDPERVFPNGRSKGGGRGFSETFSAIRAAAGLSSQITIAGAGKPSFRKSCNQEWNDLHGGLGGYVLGHRPSGVNQSHYQNMIRAALKHIRNYELPPAMLGPQLTLF